MFTPAFFEHVIATVSEGLFVVGEDGRILLSNPAFEQMTGYSHAESVGVSCALLDCDLCLRFRAEASRAWCIMFSVKSEDKKQCSIRRKDGSWLSVVKNARRLPLEGGGMCVVETLTDISTLLEQERKIFELSRLLETEAGFEGLVGASPAMRDIYRILERAAYSDAPVLLVGESGTGKELAAHAVHMRSARRDRPFVSVNCAALNEAVLESELFGHVRGAFTGANRDREGRFAVANSGTLFLDEIGDTPLSIQVKLLRVLETGRYEPVGDNVPRVTDVRLVTATNRPLEHLVRQGLFREDLFYRINVIPVRLPSLRDRTGDIRLLTAHLLEHIARRKRIPAPKLTASAFAALHAHSWPGNVRELKNALEYAVTLAGQRHIEAEHLPQFSFSGLVAGAPGAKTAADAGASENCPGCLGKNVKKVQAVAGDAEREALVQALAACGGNISQAARFLGIHRSTLHARLHRFGIRRGEHE